MGHVVEREAVVPERPGLLEELPKIPRDTRQTFRPEPRLGLNLGERNLRPVDPLPLVVSKERTDGVDHQDVRIVQHENQRRKWGGSGEKWAQKEAWVMPCVLLTGRC